MQCVKCGKKVYAKETCVCGEKAPKLHSGGVAVNTVVCFILTFISVFCLILTLSLRTMVNKNLIVKSVEKTKLAELVIDDGKKLDQYIYDEYINDPRITVDNVDNLLEDSFIKDFIIEKVEAYQDYGLGKGDVPYITADEIIKLIEDNEDLLYSEAGLRFLEPDKAELRDELSDLNEFERFTEGFLDTSLGSRFVQTFFSFANVIFLTVLLFAIFIQWIIVYKVNSRRTSKMLIKYAIAGVIPSVLILVSMLCLMIVPNADTADKLLGSAKYPFLLYSLVLLAISAVILLIGIITYKNGKRSGKSENVIETAVKAATPVGGISSNNLEVPVGMVCPQCSHRNKENAAFCSRCGTRLK